MNTHELNLVIKNFQIIKSAEFKFEKGINLIVGQSANGKSSILRSIKTLLLNSSGSQKFIKHGTDSTSVLMVYNDNIIEWKRTKAGSKYIINGQEYSKLGTSNITKVLDNSGFVIDYKNDILNLEGAWQILFPFDKSDAELFKLFENIFCVSDSGKIFQSFKAEEDRLGKELQEYTNNFNKNKIKIEAIEDLQNKVDIDKLKRYKEKLINTNENLYLLTSDIKILKNNEKFIDITSRMKSKVVVYNSNNNITRYKKLNKDIKFIEQVNKYPEVSKNKIKTFDNSSIKMYNSIKESLIFLKSLNKEIRELKEKKGKIEQEILSIDEKLSKYDTCSLCGSIIVK